MTSRPAIALLAAGVATLAAASRGLPALGYAVINGYSENPLGDLWVAGTFTVSDGTYVPFSCGNQAAFDDGPACNDSAFITMPGGLDPNSLSNAPVSSVSQKWAVQVSSSTGTFHLHWTLTAVASLST